MEKKYKIFFLYDKKSRPNKNTIEEEKYTQNNF